MAFLSSGCWSFQRLQWRNRCSRVCRVLLLHNQFLSSTRWPNRFSHVPSGACPLFSGSHLVTNDFMLVIGMDLLLAALPLGLQSISVALVSLLLRLRQCPTFRDPARYCWHGIWPDGLCGFRPKAAGMRPVACGPHGPPPAPMPRSRSSSGSDARHRSPDVILGFAEYALLSHIYLPVFLFLFTL